MFEENVIPVGTLSLGLCRGAVCTEADEVVFPCKVIGAFGIDASDSYVAEAYRSVAQCYPGCDSRIWLYVDLKYQQRVARDLRRHKRVVAVDSVETVAQPLGNIF